MLATCTARRAVSAATDGASSAWEANPQVPFTITRTAKPTSRLTTAVSSSPSRSWTVSVLMRCMRRSAWLAPAAVAAECGLGELQARQVQEVRIDPLVRCHGSTVTIARYGPL